MKNPKTKTPGLDQYLTWVAEAELAHAEWRREAWTDCLFRESKQWSDADAKRLIAKDVNPVTVNRVFPIINLITGTLAQEQHDLVAVARTSQDSETSQLMSEGLAFVMDQNLGYKKVYEAFGDQVLPGVGFLGVEQNPDPRQEIVKIRKYPWYSIWWDPFSDPWLDPEGCRYSYYADWKDLDALCQRFPKHKADLIEHFGELTNDDRTQLRATYGGLLDEGTIVEEKIRELIGGTQWADARRRRVRPVQMWYAQDEPMWFAVLPDGRAFPLDKCSSPSEQFQLVQASSTCVQATVRNIHVATFVGKVLLDDRPSPLPHDQFPFVPFVGYLDVFRQPFGAVRTIRDQQMEINKRRSMGLSLITNRRVIMEKDTADDPNQVYEEVNRQDGLVILRNGKSETFKIQELGSMAPEQFKLQEQTERELQEIVGVNDEAMGYQTRGSVSNVALENKQARSSRMTAGLMLNLKTSQKVLGERIIAQIQNDWTGPKALRVTDRATGAEKFVELNKLYFDDTRGTHVVRNSITQGRYDVTVSDRPMSDTVRDKNLELIFSAIQKAPPEAIAPLLNLAFELTDLPNKAQLLHQLRAVLGIEPIDPLLTATEADEKARAKQQALEQQRAEESDLQRREREAALEEIMARVQETLAKAQRLATEAQLSPAKLAISKQTADVGVSKEKREAWAQGRELAAELQAQQSMTKPKEEEVQ